MGAMGFGPGPLANRPQPTKEYNWAGPANLACEPNSRVETHISSHIRKGVVMLKDENIGFDGYFGTWILRIYRIYRRYIGGYFYMNIDI